MCVCLCPAPMLDFLFSCRRIFSSHVGERNTTSVKPWEAIAVLISSPLAPYLRYYGVLAHFLAVMPVFITIHAPPESQYYGFRSCCSLIGYLTKITFLANPSIDFGIRTSKVLAWESIKAHYNTSKSDLIRLECRSRGRMPCSEMMVNYPFAVHCVMICRPLHVELSLPAPPMHGSWI